MAWGLSLVTNTATGHRRRGDAGVTASGDELGALVARLRRSYSVAVAFARDLPGLGRCLVEIDRPRHRKEKRLWVARFPTRLYVETHVRNQLDHLVGCLRDEMLDPAKEERLGPIVSSLEASAGRLTSWKRVKGAFLRLPPVAAALPVLVTAATNPLTDVESREVMGARVPCQASDLLRRSRSRQPLVRPPGDGDVERVPG